MAPATIGAPYCEASRYVIDPRRTEMSVGTTSPAPARFAKAPLFVIAGSHASLHWAMATFYLLLPFIQQSLGLTYTQAGALASVVHLASFAVNLPGGMIVDLSGKRLACQLVSLVFAAVGMLGLAFVGQYWAILAFTALIAAMNTLWHPAAISFLSSRYADQRGLALSFHTVGASIGDALAPMVVGTLIAVWGWQAGALVGAGPPLVAAVVLVFVFVRRGESNHAEHMRSRTAGGFAGYVAGISSVVKDVRIWLVCALAGLRGTAQAGLRAFLPLYAVNELGANAIWAGIVMVAFQGAGGLATPFAGAWSDRYGRQPVLFIGLAIAAFVTLLLPHAGEPWTYAVLAGVIGASLFSLRPVIQGWALDITPTELGGSTISILFGAQAAFSMTVPLLGGMAADRWGLASAFYLFAAAAFVAAVLAGAMGSFRSGASGTDVSGTDASGDSGRC
ncbi:MAG: MFS family permease [Gammaproteobacteria bacterium]